MSRLWVFCAAASMLLARPAVAQTSLVSDRATKELCENVGSELQSVGISVTDMRVGRRERRQRRRAFSGNVANSLASCKSDPDRIEVFYADGSTLGVKAFSVPADPDASGAAVYVSERIRSERFVADVLIPVVPAPRRWWLGVGFDAWLFSGSLSPVGSVGLNLGHRFHRHWSVGIGLAAQMHRRDLRRGDLVARTRADRIGASVAFHPLVRPRLDLALELGAAALRLAATGSQNEMGGPSAQTDARWFALIAADFVVRVGLTPTWWLRFNGGGATLVPRAVVAGAGATFGSVSRLSARGGLGLEVHF